MRSYPFLPSARRLVALAAMAVASPTISKAQAAEPAGIRVCTHPAAGFFTRDAARQASGLEFDLLTGFTAAARSEVVFVDAPTFDQLLQDTEAGRCQIGASTITVTEERKTRFLFSIPYFPNRIVVVQNAKTAYAQPADLKDRRVAVVKGTISSRLVSAIPGARPVLVADDDAAFTALLKGEADALACDSAVVLHHLGLHPELALAFPIGDRAFFAFAFPKDSKLVTPVNDYVKGLMRTGEFTRLLAKHFGAQNADVLAADVVVPAK